MEPLSVIVNLQKTTKDFKGVLINSICVCIWFFCDTIFYFLHTLYIEICTKKENKIHFQKISFLKIFFLLRVLKTAIFLPPPLFLQITYMYKNTTYPKTSEDSKFKYVWFLFGFLYICQIFLLFKTQFTSNFWQMTMGLAFHLLEIL